MDHHRESEESLPKPQKVKGLSGIVNRFNTCYMNSAVQAFSHNYLLTQFLFNKKEEIYQTLLKNARKIFKDNDRFKIETLKSDIPIELREKIQNDKYQPDMLDESETILILNNTITAQLIRLLEKMWDKNWVVVPTSFLRVFTDARNKFFYGYDQHDAEEAYSCILQSMQEELSEEKNIKFKTSRTSVQSFLQYKVDIMKKIQETTSLEEKSMLLEQYKQKKKEMPIESLTIESYREMKKYYGQTYSRITEIFSGFLYSSTKCPDPYCGYSSNKFDPFLHLSLPMPGTHIFDRVLTIDDCIHEYCKEEILDDRNLWLCEGCKKKVRAVKKLQLWSAPPVLVIQLKRFGIARRSKDSRLIQYPTEHFDISNMMTPAFIDSSKCYQYRLQCIVNHTGNLSGGHYFTYCMDEDTKTWYEFNDSIVKVISSKKVVTSNAYILYYVREDMIKE